MKIYRRLNPIKAISFDLDDTLYDNHPVIIKAEQAQFDYLQQNIPQVSNSEKQHWIKFRFQLLKAQPHLRHNITQLRQTAIELQLIELGVNPQQAKIEAQRAFEVFIHHRHQIEIAPDIMQVLIKLAQHYPLIAITNGNACIKTMGLADIFQFALLAGDKTTQQTQGQKHMEQKPSVDMFIEAAQKLKLAPKNILHIGDSQHSDIGGAHNAEVMSIWINPNKRKPTSQSSLPHGEINQITQLTALIPQN